jgi:hypothetical protein
LNEKKVFSFSYQILGFSSPAINKIFLKTVSGYSSFVDYLLFYQNEEPNDTHEPLYAIEETKTDDKESRNTGVFQRASKFVYIDSFYPKIKKIMLYSLQIEQKEIPTDTSIFGTRCLLTLGVEILGKQLDFNIMKPFSSVDELIALKNSMRRPPAGNVPIQLIKTANKIQISGRLIKSGTLSHDPNIGSLSLISATLRSLGWDKEIEIILHGLKQSNISGNNKFILIAKRYNISLKDIELPIKPSKNKGYWKYETEGEKLGTIFIHLAVENFTKGFSIYENHAGCERGYFITQDGSPITVGKYSDREQYKNGDKTSIIYIPDLVLIDMERLKILNIEGKTFDNQLQGIRELNNYDEFENNYIKPHYPDYSIVRTVVLYGGLSEKIDKIEVSFLLNREGKMILGVRAPELFCMAIKNLLSYWMLE